MEGALIRRIFDGHKPFVIALKSWIGHLAAACGAVELAIALACVDAGYLPEIRNLSRLCHKDINFVVSPQAASLGTMVIQNFGFGGQNCALVVERWKE
jgi:3-oxoacyl-[acyl-carrier-protein] synthase II